jgi:hypothetical protein
VRQYDTIYPHYSAARQSFHWSKQPFYLDASMVNNLLQYALTLKF